MNSHPVPAGSGSVRRAMLLAFLPLGTVVIGSLVLVLHQVQIVHTDVQRMFVEHREVVQVRTLLDELRGIQRWIDVLPQATAEARDLIEADQRHHLRAAQAMLLPGHGPDDPLRPEHEAEEMRIVAELRQVLDRLATRLDGGAPIQHDEIAAALRLGAALASSIEAESARVGDDLDRRSQDMVQLVLLVGLVVLGTLGIVGWLLVRRVLRPLETLRAGALQLAEGRLSARLPVDNHDEIGALGATFNLMAARLEASQKDLEQRIEQRSREVLRTAHLADLGTLAAGIAHEINNPLAAIVACAEGLLRERRDGKLPPHAREYLEIVLKEAMRARDTTARVLQFARQEQPEREPVRLDEVLREVGAMLQHEMSRRGVRLSIEPGADPLTIVGSGNEWRQVCYNLLRNALDASPDGGVVAVRAAHTDGFVTLTVDDQGSGVPPELRERVFEPFFTTKAPGRGTGLGLAISHRIVTGHGGRITITGAPGGGARFIVEVPAAAD